MDNIQTLNISPIKKWKVLVVDNDLSTYDKVLSINSDWKLENVPIEFLNAFNAESAMNMLDKNKDIALIFLDVCPMNNRMEIELLEYIRKELCIEDSRIVLITNDGSLSLDDEFILEYDINGYEIKSDLFFRKMNTIILSSIRSFRDIRQIKHNKDSLSKILDSITELYEKDSLNDFLLSNLSQLDSIINQFDDSNRYSSLVAIRHTDNQTFNIMGGTGKYENAKNRRIRDTLPKEGWSKLKNTYAQKDHELFPDCYIANYRSSSGNEAIVYMENDMEVEIINKEYMDLFYKSISAIFDNLCLNLEIEGSQREILNTLGEVAEARSEETGFHLKRVSKYAEILGRIYGLSEEENLLLSFASPMHDIGKIAIPDNILLKPGKLTNEEFAIMKTHTTIGHNLLKNSNREIVKIAAIVANEHHEKYNGKGYPNGLKGEDIHIYGRIIAVADVFDALGSKRTYKNPWTIDDILKLFKEERGQHFDPFLVDILLDNIHEFIEVRDKYKDEDAGKVFTLEKNYS